MSFINTSDDVIAFIRGFKVDKRVGEKAPQVFGGFVHHLLRNVKTYDDAERFVYGTLSRALRELIGSENNHEAVIDIALILWICEFLIGTNLRNALGEIADRRFMPIPDSHWKSLDTLFHPESGTITGLSTKTLDDNRRQVYPVLVDKMGVGRCIERFINLIRHHMTDVPISADHAMIMLNINEPTPNRWSEVADIFTGPIENGKPIDESFVYFLNLLTREYWRSSPELDKKLCRPPSTQAVNRKLCCVMYVVIVLVTFMLSYE